MAKQSLKAADWAHIDKDPDPRVAATRVRNVALLAKNQFPDIYNEGKSWYENVNAAAAKGAAGMSGRTTKHAAGVISAVSPNMDWDRNNIDAFDELSSLSGKQWSAIRKSARTEGGRTDEAKSALSGLSVSSATDAGLIKAHRIWHGGEDFEDVLSRQTSPKTNSFAHNIWKPHESGHVTADGRHSDIIVDSMRPWELGSRGISSAALKTGKQTRYEDYEHATRIAAKSLNLLPHEAQAIAWEMGKRVERNFNPDRKQGDARRGQSYSGRMDEFSQGRG